MIRLGVFIFVKNGERSSSIIAHKYKTLAVLAAFFFIRLCRFIDRFFFGLQLSDGTPDCKT